MDIYLLPQKRNGYILYSEDIRMPETIAAPEAQKDGDPDLTATPGDGGKAKFRTRLWEGLKAGYRAATLERSRVEQMLQDAGEMPALRVYFSDHLSEAEAKEIYRQLIEAQVRKHKRWMMVDGALLPLGVLFTVVPGPNFLLAYLAWRTLSHYKLQKKGRRALDDNGATYIPEPMLRQLTLLLRKRFSWNRKGKIRRMGLALGLEQLEQVY